jgi:hypothetical protein
VEQREGVGGSSAEVDRTSLLTVLTTEHLTLQGARASTISESSARAALYVGAVSSALIALGFLGQASEFGAAFDAFALVVLPTVYLLGLFTFVRPVQCSIEDLLYGRAINRIRGFYLQLAGEESRYILLGMIAVLNSVVGGTTLALSARLLGASITTSVLVGGAALVLSLAAHRAAQRRTHAAARESASPLFPTTAKVGGSS